MKEDILTIPDLIYFDRNWNNLQKFLKSKGNPPWKCSGNLDLSYGDYGEVKSLGNLQSVGGNLNLRGTPLSKKYLEEEIRQIVEVGWFIYRL